MSRFSLLSRSALPAPPSSNGAGTSSRTENGYVDAHLSAHAGGRAEFQSMFGDLARGKRNWQLVAYAALGIAAIESVGLVTAATQSRITPYVVEVDRLGQAQAFGPAEAMKATDRRVVVRDLTSFIRDLRTVTADPAVQADLVTRAYAFVDKNAAGFLNEYFADPENDPRLLAADLTRLVDVTSVLPVPGAPAGRETWKVTWTETAIPHTAGAASGLSTTSAWEGYLSTRMVPPTTADARMAINPLGLFITSINWTKLATRRTRALPDAPAGPGGAGVSVPVPAPSIPPQQE